MIAILIGKIAFKLATMMTMQIMMKEKKVKKAKKARRATTNISQKTIKFAQIGTKTATK